MSVYAVSSQVQDNIQLEVGRTGTIGALLNVGLVLLVGLAGLQYYFGGF